MLLSLDPEANVIIDHKKDASRPAICRLSRQSTEVPHLETGPLSIPVPQPLSDSPR